MMAYKDESFVKVKCQTVKGVLNELRRVLPESVLRANVDYTQCDREVVAMKALDENGELVDKLYLDHGGKVTIYFRARKPVKYRGGRT